jgi:NAD(P)-dependent dehydrogenase (short-subunit alcohol dehydrogenase family)
LRQIIKELVRQGAAKAICAARTSSKELDAEVANAPEIVQVIKGVDVAREETMAKMCQACGGEPLDMVINNAGYFYGPAESVGVGREGHLNYPQQLLMIDVCAIGPLRVTSSLYKAGLLVGGKSKAIVITSQAGSCEWRFTQNPTPQVGEEFHGNYGHHMSRAACNIMAVLLSQELKAADIPVQLLHPGFNRTQMTQKYAHIWDVEGAVEPSVGAKRVLYESLKTDMYRSGSFINAEDGKLIPW